MSPTLLIVDDHPSFRTIARVLLESDGFDVVGEATDGAEAIEAARRLRPQVVLLDIQLPDMDGFDVAEQLAASDDSPAIVLTSSRDVAEFGGLVEKSSARGFVAKAELSGAALASLIA